MSKRTQKERNQKVRIKAWRNQKIRENQKRGKLKKKGESIKNENKKGRKCFCFGFWIDVNELTSDVNSFTSIPLLFIRYLPCQTLPNQNRRNKKRRKNMSLFFILLFYFRLIIRSFSLSFYFGLALFVSLVLFLSFCFAFFVSKWARSVNSERHKRLGL